MALLILFLSAIALILLLLPLLLTIYARWNYGSLERVGLSVVRPHWLLGSDPHSYSKPIQEQDLEWVRKHGPVFGGYEGRAPSVYITDPEVIRRIFVRDTDHFYDRRSFETGISFLDEMLDFMPGEKWKHMRSLVTPLFTSAKIRQFGSLVNELADEYVEDLHARFKRTDADVVPLNPRDFVIPILVEMIAQCFLGISVEDRKNPHNAMIQLLKKLSFEDVVPNFLNTSLLQSFPFLRKWIFPFPAAVQGLERFIRILEHLIGARRQQKHQNQNEDKKHLATDIVEILDTMMGKLDTPEYKRLRITRDTVLTRGWSIFIPGYETMALVFTMCAYHFAKNPEMQERATAEVDALYAKLAEQGKFELSLDQEALAELPFLGVCIQEVLRLNPAFSRPERMCNRDWSSDGLQIKKGMNVVILTWAANRNPEFYPEPERFVPERWLSEQKEKLNPFAFTSFGFGHRNCIGQRLGVHVPKLILCRLLKEFKFVDRPDTVARLKPGWPALVRYEPFLVDIVRRDLDINGNKL